VSKTEHKKCAARPANSDNEAWKAQGQPWRTELEIDKERQKFLAEVH